MLRRRFGKSLSDFKFGTSIGRFLNDGAASTAVKGLNKIAYDLYFPDTIVLSLT